MAKVSIILGGSGFVGVHLARYLTGSHLYDHIIIADLKAPPVETGGVTYLYTDVRHPIDSEAFRTVIKGAEVTIYNLAAVCRIPGFPDKDYFETNIRSAETICRFACEIGCNNIVFTSSISIYGASEEEKEETSLPQPDNPYGVSKLIAEHIHQAWQVTDPKNRLHILRAGIIFGKDENANFTRLYKAITGRYFFYPGRRDTRKASIYVKDVAEICAYFAENLHGLNIYNLCYPASPSISDICIAIADITGKSRPHITVPGWLLLIVAGFFTFVASLAGRRDIRFHPDRVRKLMLSTNISGEKLRKMGYVLKYGLKDAISDWLQDNDGKGLY